MTARPTSPFTLPLGNRICENPTPPYQAPNRVRRDSSGRSISPPPKCMSGLDKPPPAPT